MLCRSLSRHAAGCAALAEYFVSHVRRKPGPLHKLGIVSVVLGMISTMGILPPALEALEQQQECQLQPSELAPLVSWMESMMNVETALLRDVLPGVNSLLTRIVAVPMGPVAEGLTQLLRHCTRHTDKPCYGAAAERAQRCVPKLLCTLVASGRRLTMPGKHMSTSSAQGWTAVRGHDHRLPRTRSK